MEAWQRLAAAAAAAATRTAAASDNAAATPTSRTPAAFQPAPVSAGRNPRTPAPVQPAPGSAGRSARTPAPVQPAAVSTGGNPNPAALSAKPVVVLFDWCLEWVEGEEGKIRVAGTTYTPQMREGASSSKGNRKVAGRVFRSSAIVKRHDHFRIESEDGYLIQIVSFLNIPKSCENGFSRKVSGCFEFGFPELWQSLVNPKMAPDNDHAPSPSETTASAPSHSVEYYIEKFLSDDFSSIRYAFTEDDSYSSLGHTGIADGLTTQSLSNLTDDNAGNIGMDVPESPPREAFNNSQGSNQHENMQIDACKQELPTEGMTPKFGATGGSEDGTGRRLRSGKVLGMPSGGPTKRGHEQSKQMVNQGATSNVDLTSHENDFSAAEIVGEEKLKSHDSRRRGRGRPQKRARGRGSGSPHARAGCETQIST